MPSAPGARHACSRTAVSCATSCTSRDVAAANVAALRAGAPGAFNVASGTPRRLLDMAEALATAFGPAAPRPEVVGGWRPGDVRHVFASPDRARADLDFAAEVDFADGMRELARVLGAA